MWWLPVSAVIAMGLLTLASAAAQQTFKIEVKVSREANFISSSAVIVTYNADVVLPDGAHAKISCVSGIEQCGAIESFHPERLKPNYKKCTNRVQNNALWISCTARDLGVYEATREGNELTIVVPSGTVRYHIDGSW